MLYSVTAGDAQQPTTCTRFVSTSSSPRQISRDPRYPAHWWTPAPKEGAPSWEILPQEAGPGEVILSKRNELGLLSNFAATPFVYEGKRYASLEGFWQMMKYPEGADDARAKFPGLVWKYTRDEVGQLTSFEAKAAGTLADQNMKKMGGGSRGLRLRGSSLSIGPQSLASSIV